MQSTRICSSSKLIIYLTSRIRNFKNFSSINKYLTFGTLKVSNFDFDTVVRQMLTFNSRGTTLSTKLRSSHLYPSLKCTQVCITTLWLQQDRRVTWISQAKVSRMLASTFNKLLGYSNTCLRWPPKCLQVKQHLTFQKRLLLWIATYASLRRSTCFSEKQEMQRWNLWFFQKFAPRSVFTSKKPTRATKSTHLWELLKMVLLLMFLPTIKDTISLRHTCSKLRLN